MPQQLVVPVDRNGEAVVITAEEQQAIWFWEFLLNWSTRGETMH